MKCASKDCESTIDRRGCYVTIIGRHFHLPCFEVFLLRYPELFARGLRENPEKLETAVEIATAKKAAGGAGD